jgi:hypothetical protein
MVIITIIITNPIIIKHIKSLIMASTIIIITAIIIVMVIVIGIITVTPKVPTDFISNFGNGHQTGNGHQNGNGYHNGNGYQDQSNNDNEEVDETPEEDYTPVPVKQLIQEFEKTCRPVIQLKQYASRVAPVTNNQNDLSRYFESRHEVVYHNRQGSDECHQPQQQHYQNQQNQYRGNGFASSGDEDNDDEDDEEDDDESLDDSLSPVDFYRVDDRRLINQTTALNTNRSSSMSTLDEYYQRQIQQIQLQAPENFEDESSVRKFTDLEVEIQPINNKAMALAVIASQDNLIAQRKQLKNTTVLENLVAGTTTPECFKKEYTEEVGKCNHCNKEKAN